MKLTHRVLGGYLVLFVLLVGVASCSSDDNYTAKEESLFVGGWKPIKEG